MAQPIFLSVASQDLALAERIYENYPDGTFFLYSKNGKNNSWFWDEIERDELPFASAIVIFWSKNYIANEGTVRELILASEFFKERRLRDCVVVRSDETPLFDTEFVGDLSDHQQSAFDAIKVFLRHKRSDILKQLYPEAFALVDDLVTRIRGNDIPFQRRPYDQDDLKESARLDRLHFRPALWIAGFNGYGRRTLVREMFRELNPTLTAVEVDLDEATLPEQLILRLESEFRGLDRSALVSEVKKYAGAGPAAVAKTIQMLNAQGRYAIIRQSRLYEESVRLPEWIDEVIAALEPGRFPQLIIVAQLPPTAETKTTLADKLGEFRLSAMSQDVATEFCWSVIAALGGETGDWTDARVETIRKASGGTPELIIAVIRQCLRLGDSTRLDEVIGREAERFSDTLSHFVIWAYGQLEGDTAAKRALLFLDDVNPAAREDIESFLDTGEATSTILSRLLQLSLIEQSPDGLFRISPLLSRRLNRSLAESDVMRTHRDAMAAFAVRPLDIDDGKHSYLRIEAKIAVELLVGKKDLSPSISAFVSAAHFLQIGIRLYNLKRYRDAGRLLQRAFENRAAFAVTAQMETCRFYGLSLIRNDDFEDFDTVIAVLRSRYQGQSIADFLEGERRRIAGDFNGALPFFRKAHATARDNRERDREERIIRPYVDCILNSHQPDMKLAISLANRGVALKRTVFSLWARARVYLKRWELSQTSEESDEASDYFDVLEELDRDPGGHSFYAQVRSEEKGLQGDWSTAIEWMEEALEASGGYFDVRTKLWRTKANSNDRRTQRNLVEEIEHFCGDKANRAILMSRAKSIARRYAQTLLTLQELQQFRITSLGLPLRSSEVRQIFLSVRDGHRGRR